jgi:nucleoside-diphosphate-sugar epimerase
MKTCEGTLSMTAESVVAADLEYNCRGLSNELPSLAGRHVLIVGGAGFLGYYLVQTLLDHNRRAPAPEAVRVTVYDNFIRGVPDWLTNLSKDPHLSVVQHDITKPLPDRDAVFHYIVHGGSIASPTFYRRYPIETMDANVNGLRNLLEYSSGRQNTREPVEGLLFFSSSEIYGDPSPENIPTPETYRGLVSCTGPRACYDESKRYCETLCVNFARQRGLPVKVARPFNNYGPGLKITDRRVLPDFARDVLAGRDIVLLSDGSPRRTFCYVADAVIGYYKILVKGRPGEAYNIGVESPEVSMAEVAESVCALARELFDYRGRVIRNASGDQEYLVDNPNRRCPIITKARTELGYDPGVALNDGLRRLLVWYAGNPVAEDA